jgi:2-iminobutanoate/2-iminopropanoate deaminase
MKKIIKTANAPAPIGPYSQAVQVDNTLYVSGQIAINPADGQIVQINIIRETNQVMENISAILKEAGFQFSDIVKTTIFLKDMQNFSHVNEVYGQYFAENFPARETVEVSVLPKNVNVEISVIAVRA